MNPIATIYIDIARQPALSIGAYTLSTRSALAAWAVCVDVPVTVAKNSYEAKIHWDTLYKAEICKHIDALAKYVYVEKGMVLEYARRIMEARSDCVRGPWFDSLEPYEDICGSKDKLEKVALDIVQANLLPNHDEMVALFEAGRLVPTILQSTHAHKEAIAPLYPEMTRDQWCAYARIVDAMLSLLTRKYETARTLRITSEVDSEWLELLFASAWQCNDLADAVTDLVEDRLLIEEDAAVEYPPLQLVQGYRL